MTLYSIHISPNAPLPAVVSERFNWFAAVLPPIHALSNRLWDQLALWVLAVVALVGLASVFGGSAAFWLYLALALAFGFAAPGAERRALKRRGFAEAGYRLAADPDLARLAALETRP